MTVKDLTARLVRRAHDAQVAQEALDTFEDEVYASLSNYSQVSYQSRILHRKLQFITPPRTPIIPDFAAFKIMIYGVPGLVDNNFLFIGSNLSSNLGPPPSRSFILINSGKLIWGNMSGWEKLNFFFSGNLLLSALLQARYIIAVEFLAYLSFMMRFY
jgi:hypothetical protein